MSGIRKKAAPNLGSERPFFVSRPFQRNLKPVRYKKEGNHLLVIASCITPKNQMKTILYILKRLLTNLYRAKKVFFSEIIKRFFFAGAVFLQKQP